MNNLGNAQESFINSFINIYRDISFKDNFRHKIIKLDNSKKEFVIRSLDNSIYFLNLIKEN